MNLNEKFIAARKEEREKAARRDHRRPIIVGAVVAFALIAITVLGSAHAFG